MISSSGVGRSVAWLEKTLTDIIIAWSYNVSLSKTPTDPPPWDDVWRLQLQCQFWKTKRKRRKYNISSRYNKGSLCACCLIYSLKLLGNIMRQTYVTYIWQQASSLWVKTPFTPIFLHIVSLLRSAPTSNLRLSFSSCFHFFSRQNLFQCRWLEIAGSCCAFCITALTPPVLQSSLPSGFTQ